jgi:hypothetical protein
MAPGRIGNPGLTVTRWTEDDWQAYYHDECARLSDIYTYGDHIRLTEVPAGRLLCDRTGCGLRLDQQVPMEPCRTCSHPQYGHDRERRGSYRLCRISDTEPCTCEAFATS